MLWNADLGNGYFQNPILYTDYSDPDVIRVNDTFYLTASSFNVVPGLPILTSKDLINWNLVNYAARKLPSPTYDVPAPGKAIWAPSIRYHNQKFWIFVGMPDEGIFVTSAEDPCGRWSELYCIREVKGFIDPCPLWDDDGNAYIVHAYAKSRIGFNSKLGIFPIDNEGTECLGDDIFIFDGTESQPTIEGPKIYKRGNWYYIFAPAGGVAQGWQTVLRSHSLYGPYEEKIVLHKGHSVVNGPHQGGLVDTPDGQEWFLHFQAKDVYGRIIHLQPVHWQAEWPVIGINADKNGTGEPAYVQKKPSGCPSCLPTEPPASDSFDLPQIGLQWQWLANPGSNFYSLRANPGRLRLYNTNPTQKKNQLLHNYANILTQKICCPSFLVKTQLTTHGLEENDRSGMIILGRKYACLEVANLEGSCYLRHLKETDEGELCHYSCKLKPEQTSIEINLFFFSEGHCCFGVGKNQNLSSPLSAPFTPGQGAWVGAKIGLYAVHTGNAGRGGFTDFDFFTVTKR